MNSQTNVRKTCDMQAGLVDEALRLVRSGFRVIPIAGKVPLVKNWVSEAARDEASVRRLFSRGGVTGVGIVIDEGFCVIDFDPRNGGDWSDYDLPDTLVVHTGGGGRHYYYKLPVGVKSQTRKLFPGVDLKGQGGYVVAPPSVHPSGDEYIWEVGASPWERRMVEAPAWVVEELVGRGERAYRTQPPVRAGGRHNYMVSLAGVLAGAGVRGEVIDVILREVYERFFEREGFDFEKELSQVRRYYGKWGGAAPLGGVLDRLPAAVREVVKKHVGDEAERRAAGDKVKKGKLEAVRDVLMAAEWVQWEGQFFIVLDNVLIPASSAGVYLLHNGVSAGAETVRQAVSYVIAMRQIRQLKGVVLGEYMVEGEVNGIYGVWRHEDGRLFCHTPHGVLEWAEGKWPVGVYKIMGVGGVSKGDGGIEDLVQYMRVAGARIEVDARVVTAMVAPILLGSGDAGFVLTGPAGVGKSTFAKALALLERGREWAFPVGTHARDYLATLSSQRITFFDDAGILSAELQSLLRSKITHAWAGVRALYKDTEVIERRLSGSMILCTTAAEELSHDLADRCFYIRFHKRGARVREDVLLSYFEDNCAKARGGLIELWCKAQGVKVPPGVLPHVRFRKWVESAYKMAVVLGVEKEFESYVRLSKLNALGVLKYGFIASALLDNKVEPEKFYRLKDIWLAVGNDPEDDTIVRLAKGLGSGQKNKREVETIAAAFGLAVRFEKRVVNTEKGHMELGIVFTRADEEEAVGSIQDILGEPFKQVSGTEDSVEPVDLGVSVLSSDGKDGLKSHPVLERDTGVDMQGAKAAESQDADVVADGGGLYPLLADPELESEAQRIMQGKKVEYDMQDKFIQDMRPDLRKALEAYGDRWVAEYIVNFLNHPGTACEIKEPEYRNFLLFLLDSLAKLRRRICKNTSKNDSSEL